MNTQPQVSEVRFVRIAPGASLPAEWSDYEPTNDPLVLAKWSDPTTPFFWVSNELVSELDSLPWPIEEVSKHDYLPQTLFRRLDLEERKEQL
jgi:hypothetical protein